MTHSTHSSKTSSVADEGSYFASFYMVAAAICFALMGIFIKKINLQFGLHEYELVFWRMLFALVVLGVQALFLHRSFASRYPLAHFWRSFAGTISLFMFFYGITHLPLATAVTFSHTSAIFLALLSMLLLKQMPSKMAWVGLWVGFLGIGLILRPTVLDFGVLPALIGLGSGLIAGYAYLQVRELSLLGEPAWRIVFYFALVSTLLSALVSAIKGWTIPTMDAWGYLFCMGACAMVGQLLMTHAYKVGRKFMVASLSYLSVVLSSLYGVWGFGEPLSALAMVGIGLVIVSGVISGLK